MMRFVVARKRGDATSDIADLLSGIAGLRIVSISSNAVVEFDGTLEELRGLLPTLSVEPVVMRHYNDE